MQYSACSDELPPLFVERNRILRPTWDFNENSTQDSKFVGKEEKPFSCKSTHLSLSECTTCEKYWNKDFENLSSQSEYATDNNNSFLSLLPPASLNCLT